MEGTAWRDFFGRNCKFEDLNTFSERFLNVERKDLLINRKKFDC